MTTHTKAIGPHEETHPHWETVREWAKATLTREKIFEAALCAATVSIIGVVVLSLHRAMENYIVLGF
jgi:hypothetical protein